MTRVAPESESSALASLLGIEAVRTVAIETAAVRRTWRHLLSVSVWGCALANARGERCPGCRVHEHARRRFDHGLGFDHELVVVTTSFDCVDGTRRRDAPPGVNPRWGMLDSCLARVGRAVLTGTHAEVAARFRIDRRKVADLHHLLFEQLKGRVEFGDTVSADDLHLLRHGTCTVVTDPKTLRFIALLPGHPHEAFVSWLQRQPNPGRITAVVSDGDAKLRAALRCAFPKITHSADPFHLIQSQTQQIRKASRVLVGPAQRKVLAQAWTGRDAAWSRGDGLNRLLCRRWHRLSIDQRRRLEQLFTEAPVLGELYALREAFIAIYKIRNADLAARALDGWLASVSPQAVRFCGAARTSLGRTWRREVLAFFTRRLTQGFTEAVNRRIKQHHLRTGCALSVEQLEFWAQASYGGLAADAIERAIAAVAAQPRPRRPRARNGNGRRAHHDG